MLINCQIFSYAQGIPVEPIEATEPLSDNNTESTNTPILSSTILKTIEQYQQEPYQVSCAPQVLNTSLKDKYNAFSVVVSLSKETTSATATAFVINATLPETLNFSHKTFSNTVLGKGASFVVGAIPGILILLTGSNPNALGSTLVTTGGSAIPIFASGLQDYNGIRAARREALYYDGVFRSLEDNRNRAVAFSTGNEINKKNNSQSKNNQLPIFTNIIVNKENTISKPIVQIFNTAGQSWTYPLNCNNEIETSIERKKASELKQNLTEIINTNPP